MLLSAVVPCFNEEESLPLFVAEFERVVREFRTQGAELDFELVLVDDGSTDATLTVMKATAIRLERSDIAVHYVSFSRNFGKEAALFAGLERAQGDLVATMDADMQDPPSLLPRMFRMLQDEDVDSVATRRTDRRGEPPVRSAFAQLFYRIISCISSAEFVDGERDFRLMRRPVVDAILSMGEYNRFSKGIYGWVGFKTAWLSYEHVDRAAGSTKWSFLKLFAYAVDGIVAFSTAPLVVASVAGFLFTAIALVAIVAIVVRTLLFGDPVGGWPSLVCIVMFFGGLQLLCTGVLGQYLAKTYLETKRRPLYLAREESDRS